MESNFYFKNGKEIEGYMNQIYIRLRPRRYQCELCVTSFGIIGSVKERASHFQRQICCGVKF
jgi:hypothetical protein